MPIREVSYFGFHRGDIVQSDESKGTVVVSELDGPDWPPCVPVEFDDRKGIIQWIVAANLVLIKKKK